MSLKTLFISMEDESTNETELVVAADDTIEIEIADAAEAGAEAEEQADNVEELGEITEGLESILVSMESAMQDGGLNPQAALFMQHAVQAHVGRLGLSASDVTPSMESFGGASGQAAATTISMEGIGDTIKKIWLAIKNAISKAIQAVKNFFAKIFGGVAKLKSRADSLTRAVNELKAFNGEKIRVPNANTLRYKGKADISSIVSGLEGTFTAVSTITDNLLAGADNFYGQAVSNILNKSDLESAKKEALDAMLRSATAEWNTVSGKVSNVSQVFSGDTVFRQDSAAGATDDKVLTIPKLIKGFGFKDLDDGGVEVPAPTQSSMLTLLAATSKILVQLENRKKDLEALTKKREEASKKTDQKVEGWVNKIKDSAGHAAASMIMRFVNKDLTRPVNAVYAHGFNVARASLALVERSVASHKKGPAKK